MQGMFDQAAGIMFGRARDYSSDEKQALDQAIVDVVVDEFGATELPVVTNLPIGHTDPQWVLPIGIEAELDFGSHALSLCESATVTR
jgi:muramoyltetrapeptide carboxypeptidase LdcA involved in peptidoglycan recycling